MSNPPLEIIELILDFVPLYETGRQHNRDLLACSEVSRAFSVVSRRRLYSIILIGQASTAEKTKAQFEALAKIFEDHPEFLLSTRGVEICLYEDDEQWPCVNDSLLARIFTMIATRQRELDHFTISNCSSNSEFGLIFGPHTTQAIIDLLPSVQSLGLTNFTIPATFWEKLPPLKSVNLDGVQLGLVPNSSLTHVPFLALSETSDVSVDLYSLEDIHRFYRRSQQPPPAYVDLSIDASLISSIGQIQLDKTLRNSVNSLQRLTIEISASKSSELIFLNLGLFRKLTNFRILCTTYILAVDIWRVLVALRVGLTCGARLLGCSSSSSLVNVDLEFRSMGAPVKMLAGIDEVLALMQHIEGFCHTNFVNAHPKLKSIKVKITTPHFEKAEEPLAPVFRSVIERCIKKLLPSSIYISNHGSEMAMLYSVPLDRT